MCLADEYTAELVKLLIAHGADVHAQAPHGVRPLHSAGARDALEALIAAGADPHAKTDGGATALHYAANVDAARFLLRRGLDVNRVFSSDTVDFATPLDLALRHCNFDVATLLTQHGALTYEELRRAEMLQERRWGLQGRR